jgi:hypothetical protein
MIVIAAGYFVDNDAPKIASVDTIRKDLSEAQSVAQSLEDALVRNVRNIRVTMNETMMDPEERRKALSDIDNFPEVRFLEQRKTAADNFIESLQKRYDSALGKLLEADSQRVDNTNRAVSLLLFRISVLAVSIFTVVLLIRAYRANTITANVFRGRMIALLAYDQDVEGLSLRAAALSAEHVDFGKEPKHPIDYMLSSVRELGKLLRPSSAKSSRARARGAQVGTPSEQASVVRSEPQLESHPKAMRHNPAKLESA